MSSLPASTQEAIINSLEGAESALKQARVVLKNRWSTEIVQFTLAAALEDLAKAARAVGHPGEAQRIEEQARSLSTEKTHYEPNAGGPPDEDAAAELLMYITNTGELFGPRSIGEAIEKNYAKKWKKGTFERAKAEQGYKYLIEAGAKSYVREFGSPGQKWFQMFDVPTRKLVAKELTDSFVTEAELGNFRG